jgi:hypothetical protein
MHQRFISIPIVSTYMSYGSSNQNLSGDRIKLLCGDTIKDFQHEQLYEHET